DRREYRRALRHRIVHPECHQRLEAEVRGALPSLDSVSSGEGPVRVAVLVSGSGTNLQALLDTLKSSMVARVVRVISNRADAGALDRARRANVATTVLRDPADANELLAALHGAQLVVLAGYLK